MTLDSSKKPERVVSETRELDPFSEAPASSKLSTASLAALYEMTVTVPVHEDIRAVVAHVLDHLAVLLPGNAVGACIVDPSDNEQFVEMRLPDGVEATGRDPSRLFPEMEAESILRLRGTRESTLHVASPTGPLGDGSPTAAVAAQAARILGVGITTAAALADRRGPVGDVQHLRNQLVQAEKLASLGQIVAGVVHELANPLTSIVAYSDYLEKKARDRGSDPSDIERLERIGEAAQRILKFSRDLVAYSRPAAETAGPVLVHEVIHKALVFCEHEFSRNDIALTLDLSDGVPPVRGVAGSLTQVFVNLFTNAAHAMAERGGELRVATRLDDDGRVAVSVTDNGIGIESVLLDRIFEPFFTTKDRESGTGLGLAIVNDIIRAHGGELSAASTAGEGTTFTLRIPVSRDGAASKPGGG